MSMAFKTAGLILVLSQSCFAEPSHQFLGKPANSLSQQAQFNLTITPDGKGLPKGKGTAIQGEKLFHQKCSSCHGPGAIGATAEPLVGEVGSLNSTYPEKTVNSYWPYATTLFDYIRRAMPIDTPFSLTPDQIYSLAAYILNQDGIIADDVELNDETLPKIIMPNKHGFISFYPDKH